MNRLNALKISSAIAMLFLLGFTNASAISPGPCDTITIDIPTVNITICEGDCFVIEALSGFETYEWSTGASSQSTTICIADTYTYTVTDVNGCSGVGIVEVEEFFIDASTIFAEFCPGDSVEVNGTYYNTPGVYDDWFLSSDGCGYNRTIVITENPLPVISVTVELCLGDTTWYGGVQYTETGVYTQVFNASGTGCDTIVTITVVMAPLLINTLELTICDGDSIWFHDKWYADFGLYLDTIPSESEGCDTIVTINLYEGPYMFPEWQASICHDDSIFCYYQWCYESGTYFDTIAGLFGDCDSINTLILTVVEAIPSTSTITPDMGTSSGSILLEDTLGYVYQWSTGATGPLITDLGSGEYSVTITSLEGCENIITYTVPGPFEDLEDIVSNEKLEVYPNPFLSDFSLTIPDGDLDPDTRLIVINYLGELVHSSVVYRGGTTNIGSAFQPGLYFVFLINHEEVLASARVVKTD